MMNNKQTAAYSSCRFLQYSIGVLVLLFAAFAFSSRLEAQTFTDRTNLLSNTNFHSGVAIGIVDMDGDGLDDIVRLDDASDLSIEYQQAPNGVFANYTFGNLGSGGSGVCVSPTLTTTGSMI